MNLAPHGTVTVQTSIPLDQPESCRRSSVSAEFKLQHCRLVSLVVLNPSSEQPTQNQHYCFSGQLVTASNEATHVFINVFYCCLFVHRGIFYQGYLCSKCGLGAHKECLSRFGSCGKTGDALYTLLRLSFFLFFRKCASFTLRHFRSGSTGFPIAAAGFSKKFPKSLTSGVFFNISFALLSSPCCPKLDRTFTVVGQKNS